MNDSRKSVARLLGALAAVLALVAFVLAVPVAAQAQQSVTVELNEQNGSGVSGSAVLSTSGDMTKVDITLQGTTGGNPAYIDSGTCANLDPNPLFQLTPVDASGKSVTTVNITLAALLKGQYGINVRKSNTQIGVLVACGDVSTATGAAATTGTPAAVGGQTTTTTTTTTTAPTTSTASTVAAPPSTGAGTTAAGGSHHTDLFVGIGIMVLVLIGGGLLLRRREPQG